MASLPASAPVWQQMSVVADGQSGHATDYLGLPVRDVDAEEERFSYIEQHRVSLCAVIALLALTSACLLLVSLVGPSTLMPSRLDNAAQPSLWSELFGGDPPVSAQQLQPTRRSSAASNFLDKIAQVVDSMGEDTESDPPDAPGALEPSPPSESAESGQSSESPVPSTLHTAPNVFYVVPFASLLSSSLAPSASSSVFSTVSSALSAARTFRSSGTASAPVYIYLYPAIHFQPAPIRLTAEDSGAGESQPLVLTTMPDEAASHFRELKLKLQQAGSEPQADGSAAVASLLAGDKPRAVLSGGQLLRGWTLTDRANVYQLVVNATLTVNQLFVSNRRATRSRLPSKPTEFYRVKDTAQGQKTTMTVESSVLDGISNLAQVEFVIYHSWTASRHFYKSHRPDGFVETDNPTMWDFGFRQGAYLRYSVENAREGMDRPGTWYTDTDTHTVYFHSDTHPDQLEVIAPVIDTVIAVEGDASDEAKRVRWVEVQSVDIAHSSWHIARGQSADYQATAWISFATVHVQYASNVVFERVHIQHTGSYAWWCEKGCTDVTLRSSELSDTASGGVRIGMDRVMQPANVPQPADVLRRVYILDNVIHHTGLVFPDGVGVLQQRVEDCVVSRNAIHHTYYSGISAGWEWGYDNSGSRNNTISHNYIHDIGQGLLTDQAGIYTLGSSNGGLIEHNVVHNVHSWAGLDWGIYLDEGSVGWTVKDNIMYNTGWASFFLHYGRDNSLTNNVFARAGPLRGDYAVDWVEKHLSMTAERNIVYDTYQPPDGSPQEPHVTFEAGNGVQVKLDYNTYWSTHSLDQRFGGSKQTLAEWQNSGQDQHSQYADPLFPHADQCDFFELDPNSPAIKLGFQPIARLEQWKPGCDDPSPDDYYEGSTTSTQATLVPASQDKNEQAGKAMNQDQLAAEMMKKDKEDKDKQQQQQQKQEAQPAEKTDDKQQKDTAVSIAEKPAVDTAALPFVPGVPSESAESGQSSESPVPSTLHTAPNVFYVVPFASLLSSSLAPSASSSVFSTVSSALSAARTFRSSGTASAPVYIYLYPAIHFQPAPIRLTAEDSGAGESQPLVLTTMPDEAASHFRELKLKLQQAGSEPQADGSAAVASLLAGDKPRAVLSGGQLLRGWTLTDRANVYQLVVNATLTVNQLFVSNRRATRSRLPSKPTEFYRVKDTAQGQKTTMTVESSVLDGISNLAQVEFVIYHSWTASRHFYKSHRPDGFVETDNPTMWDFGFRQGAYLRYSVENAREGMDRPGTWYTDTDTHTVYFHSDTHPDQLEVIAPVIDTVIAVEGDASDEAKRVRWVEVQSVDIAHSSWHIARGQSADYQATAWISFATVHVQYASNVVFERVHIQHTGSYAWWCEKGCTDVTLRSSELSDTASGGVRIGMDRVMQPANVPQPADVLRRVYILDNVIHHTGLVFPDGVGVLQQRVEDCVVSRNAIHHTYYSGISAGWEWGYDNSGSRNNTISHNYIHDIGQGLLTDQAGIYTLGSSNGGLIEHNVVHNVHSWAGLDWGIYLDEGSVGWTVKDNIMYNTGWASFFLHYGRDNSLTNNVFARAGPLRGDYAVDWVEKHLSMTAERNIVYDTYQPPDGSPQEPHVTFEAGNGVQVKLDYNTYWSTHSLDQRFGGSKQTLAEWQNSGQDQHSQYADPLFPHADQCDFFELDPNSPAIKLGFQPIARLEQWKPGCDDPSPDDYYEGSTTSTQATLVPASQDKNEQAGKAMNQDQLAAEMMKKDKEDKDKQQQQQQKQEAHHQ